MVRSLVFWLVIGALANRFPCGGACLLPFGVFLRPLDLGGRRPRDGSSPSRESDLAFAMSYRWVSFSRVYLPADTPRNYAWSAISFLWLLVAYASIFVAPGDSLEVPSLAPAVLFWIHYYLLTGAAGLRSE